MIIREITYLAKDALKNRKKYNAFMGISLNNRFFSKEVMRRYINWCSETFKETIILIMDDPERYNYLVLRNMPIGKSTNKVRYLGRRLKVAYEKILRQFNISNVKIVLFNELWRDKEFIRINNLVEEECEKNPEFKESSMKMTLLWIGKKIKNCEESINKNDMNILNKHIREELASLFYLTEKGYKIELDPTPEFNAKKQVYEGKFRDIANKIGITNRGHLNLIPESVEDYSGDDIKKN